MLNPALAIFNCNHAQWIDGIALVPVTKKKYSDTDTLVQNT